MEKKPGKKTTEFWFAIAGHILGTALVLCGLFLGETHWAVTLIGAVVNLGSKISYDFARASVKNAEHMLEAAKARGAANPTP